MDVKKKYHVDNHDGQALIEMVVFFPLLALLFFYFLNVTASINGAINQQKITRAYFFARLKNNSLYPFSHDVISSDWSYVGMSFIGWSEKFNNNDEPLMPCYLAKVPFFSSQETACSNQYSGKATNYIRVGTVFGLCGSSYQKLGQEYIRGIVNDPQDVISWQSCTIKR